MPVFVLSIKVDLENVSSLAPKTQSVWVIDAKNGQSDETRRGVTISAGDDFEIEGSRGTANLIIKFADAKEKSTCRILSSDDKKLKKLKLRAVTDDNWTPFLAMEARGMDVLKVDLGDNFVAASTEGTIFDVDLSDGDWADYDEPNDLPVSVTNAITKVEVLR
ncbi:hypothetical protein CTAYLR_002136 [Chrysophaeum taylorii]|uniref:Uncharacterized protein n=1 Tax=Chrysophaeum taylorii TaxID=2483200 RepID=A0AAD7UPP4_9STRA|nr:hypothetical protein CTAYLR_002136 [Chrysophaeum taylorii]